MESLAPKAPPPGRMPGAKWWREAISIGVGVLPFVGTAQSLAELLSGKDYITGEPVPRWLAGAGLLAGIIPGAKGALKAGTRLAREAAERVTGARQVLNPNNLRAWDQAEVIYGTIRSSSDDIASIAKNTGMPEFHVRRIKEHLFFKDHSIAGQMRRFDADPDIVNAWSRLQRGDFIGSDLRLLRHELFEAKFESLFKTTYEKAHQATIRAGYPWTP